MSSNAHDQFAASLRDEANRPEPRPRDSKGRFVKPLANVKVPGSSTTVLQRGEDDVLTQPGGYPVSQDKSIHVIVPASAGEPSTSVVDTQPQDRVKQEDAIASTVTHQEPLVLQEAVADAVAKALEPMKALLQNSLQSVYAAQEEHFRFFAKALTQIDDDHRAQVRALQADVQERLDGVAGYEERFQTPSSKFLTPKAHSSRASATLLRRPSSQASTRSEPVGPVRNSKAPVKKSFDSEKSPNAKHVRMQALDSTVNLEAHSVAESNNDDAPPLASESSESESDDDEGSPSNETSDDEDNDVESIRQELISSPRLSSVTKTYREQVPSVHTSVYPAVAPTVAPTGVAAYGADPSLVAGLRKAIPDYYGDLSKPNELDAFIDATDRYWRRGQLSGDTVMDAIVGKLKSAALTWWTGLKQDGIQPTDWVLMRDMMRSAFIAKNLDADLRAKLWTIQQRTTVQKYIDAFQRVAVQIVDLTDAEAAAAFQKGLRAEILEHMPLHDIYGRALNCTALKRAALDRELKWKAARAKSGQQGSNVNTIGGTASSSSSSKRVGKRSPKRNFTGNNRRFDMECRVCGHTNHTEDRCYAVLGTPEERAAKKKALIAKRAVGTVVVASKKPSRFSDTTQAGSKEERTVGVIIHTDARSVHAAILDNGAQASVVHERMLLDNFIPATQADGYLTAANGTRIPVLGKGTVRIVDPHDSSKWIEWNDVFLSADVQRNVLATSPLVNQGMEIRLGGATPGVFDDGGECLLRTELRNGLTFVKGIVKTDSSILAIDVNETTSLKLSAGNAETGMSLNYGIVASVILEKKH